MVIARNEAATLRACLESARGLVESIILLDTGSSDATVAIAQACGAQVHHFAWCDDVAAARNAALAHSPAAWNLILDADERLADDAAGAKALIEATRGPATRIGLLPVISAFDLEDQVAHSTSWLPRLLLEMPHWQQSPDFFFVLGDLLLDWALAHPAQAEQDFLPLVESAYLPGAG